MTPEEVERAIANAHQRFTAWRGLSFAQRAALLHRAAVMCRERSEMLATLMAIEMGKRASEGREEVDICAAIFDYYADHGEQLLVPQTLPSPWGDGTLLRQPLKSSWESNLWNYPCYQVVRFAAPQPDGRKCRAPEARLHRTAVCGSAGNVVPRRRFPGRRLHPIWSLLRTLLTELSRMTVFRGCRSQVVMRPVRRLRSALVPMSKRLFWSWGAAIHSSFSTMPTWTSPLNVRCSVR